MDENEKKIKEIKKYHVNFIKHDTNNNFKYDQ